MLGKNLLLSTLVNGSETTSTAPSFLNDPCFGIPQLGTWGSIHIDTLVLSAVSMALVLVASRLITLSLVVEGAGGTGQQIMEMLYGFTEGIAKGQIGHHYKKFFPLIAGIFMFVLTANVIGVGPWKAFEPLFSQLHWTVHGEPFELCAPTTDFNCVFGLTIFSILAYLIAGFVINGAPKFANNYFNPLNPHFYLEWLDLVIRPSTLTLRLMLVITADELLRMVALMMVPLCVPVAVMSFELCICLIQAFVFAVLTSIYIGLTVQAEH